MWIKISGDYTAKLNTDFIAVLYPEEKTVMLSSGDRLALSEGDYNEVEAALFPTRKKVAKANTSAAEFLTRLHNLTGGKGSALASPKRLRALQALLLIEGMTPEKLVISATNIGKDEWLQGKNDNKKRYGDLDFLLRPDKAVKYAEISPEDRKRKMF